MRFLGAKFQLPLRRLRLAPAGRCASAWLAALTIALLCGALSPAHAVPAFAIQTGQPCAACHVGAFGPQLKPYGRDFKLNGYVASDGQDHGPPLAVTTMFSFTHTAAPQPGGAAPNFAANDNPALDQASFYYAGRLVAGFGAFMQMTYDGVGKSLQIDNVDIRRAGEAQLFGEDAVWGITFNNNPTVQDPWNSTPAWGFPYNASALAPTPVAATLVDGGLAQHVAGAGAYLYWNNLIYAEFDAYGGFSPDALTANGLVSTGGGPAPDGPIPYGRIAVIKDWENSHLEVGAYSLSANLSPAGSTGSGLTDRLTDFAGDATFQYIWNPAKVTSDMLSAHATVIQEWAQTPASEALFGATSGYTLNTARADVSYSFAATVTPSVQIFRTFGSADPAYWSTPTGSPNSSGAIFEIAYVPWGKPDSPFPGVNARLAVQYVDYNRFNGSAVGASRNNNLYLSLWLAARI
jgi:hypothetical protein